MAINIKELDCWDLTWFAADSKGRIGVFFSNGTTSVLINNLLKDQNYETCYDYFDNLNLIESGENLNTELQNANIKNTNSEAFVFYAKKGLYVYDIDNLSQPYYNLIATPSIPLLIDNLDKKISKIIEKYEGRFSDIVKIESVQA